MTDRNLDYLPDDKTAAYEAGVEDGKASAASEIAELKARVEILEGERDQATTTRENELLRAQIERLNLECQHAKTKQAAAEAEMHAVFMDMEWLENNTVQSYRILRGILGDDERDFPSAELMWLHTEKRARKLAKVAERAAALRDAMRGTRLECDAPHATEIAGLVLAVDAMLGDKISEQET